MTVDRPELDGGELLTMLEIHVAAFCRGLTGTERVRLYLAARAIYGDVVNAVEQKIGKRLPVSGKP